LNLSSKILNNKNRNNPHKRKRKKLDKEFNQGKKKIINIKSGLLNKKKAKKHSKKNSIFSMKINI
jgi:hypothetical protein